MSRRYLAYGSNLCAEQLAQRGPAAVAGEVVELRDGRFVINRLGVATMLPVVRARTLGLTWYLTEACEAALDGFEGVATGHYRKTEIVAGEASALVYLSAEDRQGFARDGYLSRIDAAAARLGLPPSYRRELASWGTLVSPMLAKRVMREYRLSRNGVHGPHHWTRVLANGLSLAALTPGADAAVVELFALLHDCRRIDEDADLGHGERAAEFVRRLVDEGVVALAPERLAVLCDACERHEYGDISDDPTIGCCWDADRLELSRLGIRPRAEYLSTVAALNEALQAAAWQRGRKRELVVDFAERWAIAHQRSDEHQA